ncbi:MAG TPA: heme lyase CcmF/NrfE family subunit [Phycisphaerae bacterium]|nr:heme lyase CcmF/NrfE family subunit [Phycisphaerae bacterium]
MSVMLGEYALSGAMLTAMAVLVAAIGFFRTKNEGLVRCVRWGTALIALLLTVSSWGLLSALINDNFSLNYVVQHSERSLGIAYKAAAFWAGQEGSLLLWAWMLSIMGTVMAFRARKNDDAETAVSLATMAVVTGFFVCVMLFAGNPFAPSSTPMTEGEGLNPLLQNFAMVAHPPMLFLGYAGFTAPFALLLGALFTGKADSQWLPKARPWILFSWIALTIGILLGAQWAYVELGWGGYWAWDPVENASLLPWLTGTALLHSAKLQTSRGIFKRWTASLTAMSFFLCVLGTYLTRSGVIQSVHAFEASSIGTFFLVFLVIIGLVSIGAILTRLELLKPQQPLTNLLTRDGLFLAANVLLVIMTALTLLGTVYPLLSRGVSETPITVGAPFYNKVILPMALALALLMAMAPALGNGENAIAKAKSKLLVMAGAAIAGALLIAVLGYTSPWAIIAAAVVTAVLASFATDLFLNFRTLFRLPAHWGAQLAHVGIAFLIAGVAGSSLYNVKQDVELKTHDAAQSVQLASYAVRLNHVEQLRRANHTAMVATLDITDSTGRTFQLKPERRFYDRGTEPGQSASEVAIRLGLSRDLYVTLAGWDENIVTVQVIINPLINWIWIGGILLVAGALLATLGLAQRAAISVPDTIKAPSVRQNAAKTARDRRRANQLPATLNPTTTGRQN